MTSLRSRTILGVSLKMYFSHARTISWCRDVAALARRQAAVTDGSIDLFVLPSHPSLVAAKDILDGVASVGSQDVAPEDWGAFTGDGSASVVAELGGRCAAVGHAERRRRYGESDALVAGKTAAALRAGLTVVVCIGESEPADVNVAADVCMRQLDAALAPSIKAEHAGRVIAAYEPVWAIGARVPAPAEHISLVCSQISRHLRDSPFQDTAVIYGGSAQPGLLTKLGDTVDGLFLGRFAHDPAAVNAILTEVAPTRPGTRPLVKSDPFWR
jgi:triosephosphate isomerase